MPDSDYTRWPTARELVDGPRSEEAQDAMFAKVMEKKSLVVSPVSKELESLSRSVGELEGMVDVLIRQLQPLIPPKPESPENEMAMAEGSYTEGSALTEQLRGTQRSIRRVTHRIQAVLEKMEL